MAGLSETIARLAASRAGVGGGGGSGRLVRWAPAGSNPGALCAFGYVPDGLQARAPLVVVLHGCTQSAGDYDHGSGWSTLADRYGFALLFPEQQRANNANLCFNWFAPDDTRRGGGEALSIIQMVDAAIAAHDLDPDRVFITGLSAGGAMTSAMLAAYPDRFAGGAIVAGLPAGVAGSVPEAFERMRGSGGPPVDTLGARVRAASRHDGPWPTVSIWHGDRDATVSAANASAIAAQWADVHGLARAPSRSETVEGQRRDVWIDAGGREVIEAYRIAGMGHGTPIRSAGPDGCGAAGPYMLESSLSSTRRIAAFWGIAEGDSAVGTAVPTQARRVEAGRVQAGPIEAEAGSIAEPLDIGATIRQALRTAGLMR